ncbi:MAG: GtrA family protein [bacterium]|nr:GtrA family protein [bacterium]
MKQFISQFVKFCITGTINAGIDFLVYLGLTRYFDFWENRLVMATGVAFVIANINSYIMNKYWTFRDPNGRHKIQYPKFFAVSLVGLAINLAVFYYLVHVLMIDDILSKVIVAAIVLVWNFFANKFWTFIKPKKDLLESKS